MREGKTIILIQPHEVMPRLMRLMTALRAKFLGPFQNESSYLFMTEGRSKPGMKLHHDGDVHSFWLQLEGRRTVTLGPPAPPEADPESEPATTSGPDWKTVELGPGSLFYMKPRAFHKVVCHERSLALSLTWEALPGSEVLGAWMEALGAEAPELFEGIASVRTPADFAGEAAASLARVAGAAAARERASRRLFAESLTQWDTVSGKVIRALPGIKDAVPRPARDPARLWAQRPAVVLEGGGALISGELDFELDEEAAVELAREFPSLPCWLARDWEAAAPDLLKELLAEGILADHDLPLLIYPLDVDELQGWDFAAYGAH